MDNGNSYSNPNPKIRANILNKLTFGYLIPLFWYGRKHNLEAKDLYDVLPENESEHVSQMLARSWNEEVEKARKRQCKPSLFKAVAKTCYWPLIFHAFVFSIGHILLRLLLPMTMNTYIKCFYTKTSIWDGIASASVLVLTSIFMGLIFTHSTFKLQELGMRMKIACSCLIYKKMMKLSCAAMSQVDEGQIINLLSNDVDKWEKFFVYVHFGWMTPIYVVLIFCIMRENIEITSIIGIFAFMFQILSIQGVFSRLIYILKLKAALVTDRRILLIKEIISGIRMIKMYTWEKPFEKLVLSSRKREIKLLKFLAYTKGISLATYVIVARNSLFVTMLAYLFVEGKLMSSENIFSIWRYFITLEMMIPYYLPFTVSSISETRVAVRRIEIFLLLKETKNTIQYYPKSDDNDNLSIVMEEISASWGAESSTNVLTDINIKMRYKQLYVVVGPAGAGKSSLLQMILGELQSKTGSISVYGKISYSSQVPWLFSGSVKNNILFGELYDETRYRNVINACALIEDFNQLPHGDKTLVGDGGVVISGGQRARINLARAVYKRADIYLLDDCLSSVDVLVGKFLYEKCFKLFLKESTCILVTHITKYFDDKDKIILMNEGIIKYQGTFANLKNDDQYSQYLTEQTNFTTKIEIAQKRKIISTEKDNEYLKINFEEKEDKESSETETLIAHSNEQTETEELIAKGKITMTLYWQYFKSGGSYLKLFLILLIAILTQLFLTTTDLWVSHISDMNIANFSLFTNEMNATSAKFLPENSNNEIYAAFSIYGFLIAGSIITILARNLLFLDVCINASNTIHNKMFTRILRAPITFFDINNIGRIINRFTQGSGSVDNQLAELLLQVISSIVISSAIFLQICVVEWWISLFIVFVIMMFVVLQNIYQETATDINRLEGVAKGPVFSHVNSSFIGLLTIRSRQLEELVYKEFITLQNRHTSAYYLVISGVALSSFWIENLRNSFIAFISYSLLFVNISSSTVNFIYIQINYMIDEIWFITKMFSEILVEMVHVERMLQFTEVEQESMAKSEPINSWPSHGCMRFDHLYVKYLYTAKPILRNLNFSIGAGQRIGIVGRTGVGKSSLIAALFRLVHYDGCISIDNVNIKRLSLQDVRSNISIVPQDSIIFTVSLRENLDPNSEYSDEIIWSALQDIGLSHMYNSLSVILDKKQLNVGHIQLLSLARVIIKKNKILVLDEATANVDNETDARVQNIIKNKFKDCTVIFIAHKLTNVINCDKVLVIDNGQILEFDHPHVLLQKEGGLFKNMALGSDNVAHENLKQITKDKSI